MQIRFQVFGILAFLLLGFAQNTSAQQDHSSAKKEVRGSTTINGQIVKYIVFGKDTILLAGDLDTAIVRVTPNFASKDERRRYSQLRYLALSVYPYAAEAVRLYRKAKGETAKMSKNQMRKYTKAEEERLSAEYEKKLKSLTKTQGYVLLKMVERELKVPFYDVLSELRGGWSAFRWQAVARVWGFNLKDGYNPKKDPLLEGILKDLNVAY